MSRGVAGQQWVSWNFRIWFMSEQGRDLPELALVTHWRHGRDSNKKEASPLIQRDGEFRPVADIGSVERGDHPMLTAALLAVVLQLLTTLRQI